MDEAVETFLLTKQIAGCRSATIVMLWFRNALRKPQGSGQAMREVIVGGA